MTPDYIEEDWVKFRRVPCKEGHIDVWMGDAACNPNDEERPYYIGCGYITKTTGVKIKEHFEIE